MSIADIIQIILSGLSLLATVAVSYSIYYLQRKHEKEIQKIEENLQKRKLKEKAEHFIINNNSEIDYLPWCIFASNLHKLETHHRKIYKEYCKCSLEVQNEILRIQGFEVKQLDENNDWLDKCLELLRKDILEHKLGRDVLYDGAKYFKRGYRIYKRLEWGDIEYSNIFRPIEVNWGFKKTNLRNCTSYIEDYLYFLYSDSKPVLYNSSPLSPIDYVCEAIGFENNEEEIVCAWIMELVQAISINLLNNRFVNSHENSQKIKYTDATIETYEDKYYSAIHALYNLYFNCK